jgi:hypothetical protein
MPPAARGAVQRKVIECSLGKNLRDERTLSRSPIAPIMQDGACTACEVHAVAPDSCAPPAHVSHCEVIRRAGADDVESRTSGVRERHASKRVLMTVTRNEVQSESTRLN